MFLLLNFLIAKSTQFLYENNVPTLEEQKKYATRLIKGYEKHQQNPYQKRDPRWFKMSDWGFQYTYKSIKSIKEKGIRKNLLKDLKVFRKIVLSTFSDTGINLKDLQVINLNLVYILSRQPVYIEHVNKVKSSQGLGNFTKKETILQAFEELKFLPLNGSNIPSFEGNLRDMFSINSLVGANTSECYVLTFYPPEGSNGVFTEKSFLESFFDKDICIFANYLPNNSSLDVNNTPHAHDLLAIPYEMYTHDLFHVARTINIVIQKLRTKQINILASGEKIRTSYYDILQEHFNKFKENKDFIYTLYQLIHEDFMSLFSYPSFKSLSKNSLFESAVARYNEITKKINELTADSDVDWMIIQSLKQDQKNELKIAYQCTFSLGDYFYSQLLSYIKEEPVEITSLNKKILSHFGGSSIFQNIGAIILDQSRDSQVIIQDDGIKIILDIESEDSFFIPAEVVIDLTTMTYSAKFGIIESDSINVEYKDLVEKINDTIISSQNNVQVKYSLYSPLNRFIATGYGLAQLGYFEVKEGSQGIHDLNDLNLAQKTWRENIINLLESDNFNIIPEVEIEVMKKKVNLYKEAIKKLTPNLKLEVIRNYQGNIFEQELMNSKVQKSIDTIAKFRKKFDKYLDQIHKESLKKLACLSKDFFNTECKLADIDHSTSVVRLILDKPSFDLIEELACLENCFPFSSSIDAKAVSLEFKKSIASIAEFFKLEKLNPDQQNKLKDKLTKISLNFDHEKYFKVRYIYDKANKLIDIEVL
jgi:hypothetical protein